MFAAPSSSGLASAPSTTPIGSISNGTMLAVYDNRTLVSADHVTPVSPCVIGGVSVAFDTTGITNPSAGITVYRTSSDLPANTFRLLPTADPVAGDTVAMGGTGYDLVNVRAERWGSNKITQVFNGSWSETLDDPGSNPTTNEVHPRAYDSGGALLNVARDTALGIILGASGTSDGSTGGGSLLAALSGFIQGAAASLAAGTNPPQIIGWRFNSAYSAIQITWSKAATYQTGGRFVLRKDGSTVYDNATAAPIRGDGTAIHVYATALTVIHRGAALIVNCMDASSGAVQDNSGATSDTSKAVLNTLGYVGTVGLTTPNPVSGAIDLTTGSMVITWDDTITAVTDFQGVYRSPNGDERVGLAGATFSGMQSTYPMAFDQTGQTPVNTCDISINDAYSGVGGTNPCAATANFPVTATGTLTTTSTYHTAASTSNNTTRWRTIVATGNQISINHKASSAPTAADTVTAWTIRLFNDIGQEISGTGGTNAALVATVDAGATYLIAFKNTSGSTKTLGLDITHSNLTPGTATLGVALQLLLLD